MYPIWGRTCRTISTRVHETSDVIDAVVFWDFRDGIPSVNVQAVLVLRNAISSPLAFRNASPFSRQLFVEKRYHREFLG